MYVVGLDKSWWNTPFLSHKWMVRGPEDIEKLREAGVSRVAIDITRGIDVVETDTLPRELSASVPDKIIQESQAKLSVVTAPRSASLAPSSHPLLTAIAEAMPAARAARDEAFVILEGIFEGMKIGKPLDSPALKRAVSGLLTSILHRPEASLILTQLQRFEADLLAHAIDACVLSLVVGKQQELSEDQLEILGIGAMIHDIGKTRLPRNLLRKSNGYTPQAQRLLNEHPRLGASLLSHSKDLGVEVLRIIAEHHEHADGSGFPEGLTAAQLSPLSQIVSVINLYDGLVSGRNGQVAHLPTQALRRLYQMGQAGVLIGEQVAWTIRALGIYPIGAVVELNTGERGVVIATNPDETLKPMIQILSNPAGQPLGTPYLVDLLTPLAGEPERVITRPLEASAVHLNLAESLQKTL